MKKSPDSSAGEYVQYAFWFPLFTLSSVSMVILNKYCAASFPQPYSLLAFQNTMTIVLNFIGLQLGVFTMRSFTAQQFKMFAIPSVLFVGMLVTSLRGLPLVSVATTVVFRALSTCVVAFGDFLFFSKKFNAAEVLCLSLVVVGAGMYSLGDLSYHPKGYSWMFANMVMFVSSQLYEKYAVVCLDQTAVGISCVQNILSLPILIFFGFFVLEERPVELLKTTDTLTKTGIFFSGIAGCALSVCYMSLAKFASATAISLTGNLNKVLSIFVGAAVFHNPLSLLQTLGLSLSVIATMAFSQGGALPTVLRGGRLYLFMLLMIIFAVNTWDIGGKIAHLDVKKEIRRELDYLLRKSGGLGRGTLRLFAGRNRTATAGLDEDLQLSISIRGFKSRSFSSDKQQELARTISRFFEAKDGDVELNVLSESPASHDLGAHPLSGEIKSELEKRLRQVDTGQFGKNISKLL
mmetsp:Transcript_34434/g.77649  ORF Transcript_34434/g.77649 Transcript_34434/m.77649 type:complete len:463 (-) Transcript_34434:9-1397(-)